MAIYYLFTYIRERTKNIMQFITIILLVLSLIWLAFNTYGFVKWFKAKKKKKPRKEKDKE